MAIEPPFFCAPAAWLAARLSGVTAWLHIQDFELDAAISLGLAKQPWLQNVLCAFERMMITRFDLVSTISELMFEHLARKGVSKERCFLFPNWVDTEAITPMNQPSPMRQELGFTDDQVVVLYSGNMGRKQGLELIIDAARLLTSHTKIRIVVCGEGSTSSDIQALAKGLINITFLPLQTLERLNWLLNMADINLLVQRPSSLNYSMPSKLSGMFASGRPIIATVPSDSQIATLFDGCGLFVTPENAELLAQAIVQLATDPDRRTLMGRRARLQAEARWKKKDILEGCERQVACSLKS